MSHCLDTYVAFCLDLHVSFLTVQHISISGFPFSFPYSHIHKEHNRNSIILSLISDTYGIFNFLIPGASFYSAIEASSWLVSIFMKLRETVWEKNYNLLSFMKVV